MNTPEAPSHITQMRIASLLPSVTDICISLGLADNLVAVTHECDLAAIHKYRSKTNTSQVYTVTKSGLNASFTQSQIDDAIKTQNSDNDLGSISLYPILEHEFKASNPTIVLTQTLCQVCAPSPNDVNDMISVCNLDPSIEIHPFEPATLMDVVDSFVSVAKACKVPERGQKMKQDYMRKLLQLKAACSPKSEMEDPSDIGTSPKKRKQKSKVLLLEWIEPPYDGGHWIPDMIEWVGCEVVRIGNTSVKSKQVTWKDIYDADPDIVLVACCGFDLQRNVQDVQKAADKFRPLRAARNNRIFACNGDLNFARPGPKLLGGIVVVAQCAYQNDECILGAMKELDFMDGLSMEWERVPIDTPKKYPCDIEDIEDTVLDFTSLHKAACDSGEMSYKDPETGYQVFTEIAHKKRGKCCGSGCRHCPFNHENVKNKAKQIKQPAFLFEGNNQIASMCEERDPLRTLSHAKCKKNVKVLFFSGGKDSFLAIRATLKMHHEQKSEDGLCLVLLTTFDAKSRVIAHQEIPIETIIRQATHLNIPLIGVPMHRGSSESYLERISTALDHVSKKAGLNSKTEIKSLVFGDLHLEHIRGWRDLELGKLGIELEYPLWNAPYGDLIADLEKSMVEVNVSAATKNFVKCGESFDQSLIEKAKFEGADIMGENGEFHTIVKVWIAPRETVLGFKV